MIMVVISFFPLRGELYLSTAGFTGMTAASPAFYYFNHIITQYQIQLPVKWHRYGHIRKNIPDCRHLLFLGKYEKYTG